MRPTRPDDQRRIRRAEICPLPRKTAELTGFVLKEDAVLAPGRAALDQLEDPVAERMKRMRDAEGLGSTFPSGCN